MSTLLIYILTVFIIFIFLSIFFYIEHRKLTGFDLILFFILSLLWPLTILAFTCLSTETGYKYLDAVDWLTNKIVKTLSILQ